MTVLQGDRLHWLACSLYVSCRSGVTPTVRPGGQIEGNCVSLTRLLRSAKLRSVCLTFERISSVLWVVVDVITMLCFHSPGGAAAADTELILVTTVLSFITSTLSVFR